MTPFYLTLDIPAPLSIWGLFLRGLGMMYFIAIAQLYHQVIPLAGASGIAPVRGKLAQIQKDYPGWRHWFYFPTLLWFNASDWFLKGLIVIGAGAAMIVVYGGPFSGMALLVCWLVYLSFDIALGFTYPWDCLLLEAGFLGLFLPALHPLPDLTVVSLPIPAVAWAYRWLLFRLLFGFGKQKFIGGSLRDSGYFKDFMTNIPLPTYLAQYAFRLPLWIFQLVLFAVFLAEVVFPFGVFITGNTRVFVAVTTAMMMIGIQLVSNFGFFNLLTILLCIPLLDRNASLVDTSFIPSAAYWFTNGVMLFLAVGGLVNLPFNSWCTFTWLHWPSGKKIQLPVVPSILTFYRTFIRFRFVHAYGVFPPQSAPPIRWVPIIEGTSDGRTWHAYEYQYMTTTEKTPPRFVAPYHPRLDHTIFYEAFGTNDANFLGSILGGGNPYDFSHSSWMACLVQRLLEGESTVYSLFRKTSFSPDKPPKAIRVNLYRFRLTTPAERQKTGHWWLKTFTGTHLEQTGLANQIWDRRWPDAVRFLPDAIHWKRRSPQTKALLELGQTASIKAIWKVSTAGLTINLPTFWDRYMIPASVEATGKAWESMPNAVAQLRTQFNGRQLDELETILGRLSLALLGRLEPHYFGKALPQILVSEYFQLALLTHHIIGKGPVAYEAVLYNPAQVKQHLADFDPERSFYYLGLFWFDMLVFQARKFRLAKRFSTFKLINGLPGFQELIPFISRQFTNIGQEQLPLMRQNPANGEWLIQENYPETVLPDGVKPVIKMKQVHLPNGLTVSALNGAEADVLYHEIFTMQSYQQHGIQITDGCCVFDVGANIGLYSLFLTQSYQNLRLFAFEPIPSLFAILQQNARSLFPQVNAQLFNIGLSDRMGTAQFTFKPALSMSASMYPSVLTDSAQKKASPYAWMRALISDMAVSSQLPKGLARGLIRALTNRYLRLPTLSLLSLPILGMSAIQHLSTKKINCTLKTISAIIRENDLSRIDVMKIDVEGSELDVIQGIDEADWSKIRQFIVEVHDLNNRVETLVSLFNQRGFRTIVDQEDWELHKLMNIYTLYAIAE